MRESDLQDTQDTDVIDLAYVLRVLRERYWVIIGLIVVVVGVVLAYSYLATPHYRSSALLLYQRNNLDDALFGSQVGPDSNNDREVSTGAILVKLDPVAESVVSRLGMTQTTSELLKMVSVGTEEGTNVVSIRAESSDPEEAADVANAFAEEFVKSREAADKATVATARELVKAELDSLTGDDAVSDYGLMLREKYESLRILEAMQDGGFSVVQQARPATNPFKPTPFLNGLLALVVSLVVGVLVAFLLDYLDKRIKDEKGLEAAFGVPVLASVPAVGGKWNSSHSDKRSREPVGFANYPILLESFRTLRSNLQYFGLGKERQAWLVTSGLPQQGKTVTTVNLGLTLALSGKRVIIVEADLRRPMVHEYLDVPSEPGLSNVLAGTRKLDDALRLIKADDFVPLESRRQQGDQSRGLLQRNFYVLPSGPLPPNPAELLSSDRMTALIAELTPMSDFLLIDTPPVIAVSDALLLAPYADGVILATRLGSTTRDEARDVRTIFERSGIRVIGVVAGGAKRGPAYYGKRGYAYGYGYGSSSPRVDS